MNKLKKYGKISLIWISFLIIYLLLLTILNYTQVLKFSSIIKVNFVIIAIIVFIFGILNGKATEKKGYLEGLKLGSIISLSFLLLNLLFIRKFSLSIFIYYLVIIVSTTFGSMLGINLRKNK